MNTVATSVVREMSAAGSRLMLKNSVGSADSSLMIGTVMGARVAPGRKNNVPIPTRKSTWSTLISSQKQIVHLTLVDCFQYQKSNL